MPSTLARPIIPG